MRIIHHLRKTIPGLIIAGVKAMHENHHIAGYANPSGQGSGERGAKGFRIQHPLRPQNHVPLGTFRGQAWPLNHPGSMIGRNAH